MDMKNLIKLFIILLLTSCASMKSIELGEKATKAGVEVSQKALDIYSLLSQQVYIDKSQQDEVKVLTDPNPSEMVLPDTKVQDFSGQFASRIEAYRSLLDTYTIFTLLTDSKYGDKTQEALTSLQKSYNSIEKLPDLPSAVSSKLPEVSKMIAQAIQVKKIKVHNEVLFRLTSLYISLWEEDSKAWGMYIDGIYDHYLTGLNSVDPKKYSVKKISSIYKEPYDDESTLILLYRLEKRDEIVRQKNDIKRQMDNFGKALRELNQIHIEMSKSRTDISGVINKLKTLDQLLKLE